jgi:cholesterol oxidase
MMQKDEFDFDQIVVGSGFGGSCSALRLSEKGNRVLVLEKGKRWEDSDFPETSWNIKKTMWAPWIGLKGLYQIAFTRKCVILHGSGVGGGSLIYGNIHLIPEDKVFESDSWQQSNKNWKRDLLPFYGLAQRMIGVAKNTKEDFADHTLRKVANQMGRGHTYDTTNTGILFPRKNAAGEDILGEDRGDPFFQGKGPERKSCEYCGACMIGCRHNSKNTLVKNYLYFAEQNGVEIRAESKVQKIEPIDDGKGGYIVTVKDTSKFFSRTYTVKTRGVVLSAGVLGSVPLLLDQKYKKKTLPGISDLLGTKVRTNSETLVTVSTNKKDEQGQPIEVCNGPSISSIMAADDETNIEVVRYNKGSDMSFWGTMLVPLTDDGGRVPRIIRLLGNMIANPLTTLRLANPINKARNTVYFLVMQTKEAFIHLELKRRWYKGFMRTWEPVQKENDDKLSTYFPIAHKAARLFTKESGGDAANMMAEIAWGAPVTAHIMSGVAIGTDKSNGVVDETGEVFGYQNLRVLDASIIPGNLGVNPSLSILALTEHAMSKVPVFNQERADQVKPILFSKPVEGLVSALDGEGDLLNTVCLDSVDANAETAEVVA